GREGSGVFLLRTGTQQEKENYPQRCLRRRKIVRLTQRSMTAGDVAIAGLSAVIDRRYSTKAHPQRRSRFFTGSERTRFPVAAKMALHTAGAIHPTTSSPMPTIGLSVARTK